MFVVCFVAIRKERLKNEFDTSIKFYSDMYL
jgi:hypothetical protein